MLILREDADYLAFFFRELDASKRYYWWARIPNSLDPKEIDRAEFEYKQEAQSGLRPLLDLLKQTAANQAAQLRELRG